MVSWDKWLSTIFPLEGMWTKLWDWSKDFNLRTNMVKFAPQTGNPERKPWNRIMPEWLNICLTNKRNRRWIPKKSSNLYHFYLLRVIAVLPNSIFDFYFAVFFLKNVLFLLFLFTEKIIYHFHVFCSHLHFNVNFLKKK